jgi:hypothetical protein
MTIGIEKCCFIVLENRQNEQEQVDFETAITLAGEYSIYNMQYTNTYIMIYSIHKYSVYAGKYSIYKMLNKGVLWYYSINVVYRSIAISYIPQRILNILS